MIKSEVTAILMNLKIVTGEQLLGYVVMPNADLMASNKFKFEKFVYIFYPAKVEIVGNTEVKLSTFIPLSSDKAIPISFGDLIVGAKTNENGYNLYTEWLAKLNLSINDVTDYISYYFSDEIDEEEEDNVKISEDMAAEILSKFTGRTKH